jgi:hypothetical protein
MDTKLTYQDCRIKDDLGIILCPRRGLPSNCSLFTPWGTRVTSCADVKPQDSVFLVPANRLFIAPVRETRSELLHINLPRGQSIYTTTLSDSPRVSVWDPIISDAEIQLFLDSQSMDSEVVTEEIRTHSVNEGNTVIFRKRLFDLLGIYPFDEALGEPTEILRFGPGAALMPASDIRFETLHGVDKDEENDNSDKNVRGITVLLLLSKVSDVLLCI